MFSFPEPPLNDLALSARAWVGARISNFFFEVGKPLEVVVIFENKGKTPAYKVRTCQVASVITRGEETQITYPEHRFSPGFTVVMPDGNTNRMANAVGGDNDPKVTEDGILTEEIAESIRRNEKTAVTYGQIQYEDIFGVPHWTTFCFNMQVFPPARGLPPTPAWASSDVGNDMDKNQKTKADQAN